MMKDVFNWVKGIKFIYFFAWYLSTYLLTIYLFAIIMPERVTNNPIVTQYTTMAANLLSFLVGYFFGGVAEKKQQQTPVVGHSEQTTINQPETK